MSEEETKVEAATEAAATEDSTTDVETTDEAVKAEGAEAGEAAPKKKGKKWPIVVGVVAVVLIAAGAGFWVWHEQPSFCNAICHTYLPTYEAEPGQASVDKWGNDVEDASGMMAAVHRVSKDQGGAEATCMSCHVPTIGEQVSEGMAWITGNYYYPLEERDVDQLVEARGLESGDEFCLNESCHNLTRRPDKGDVRAGQLQPALAAAQRAGVQQLPQGAPRVGERLHAVPQRVLRAGRLADVPAGQQAYRVRFASTE